MNANITHITAGEMYTGTKSHMNEMIEESFNTLAKQRSCHHSFNTLQQ